MTAGDIHRAMPEVTFGAVSLQIRERARGTNVFVFGPTGQIETATGFMNPSKSA